jgi:hypothetical protein
LESTLAIPKLSLNNFEASLHLEKKRSSKRHKTQKLKNILYNQKKEETVHHDFAVWFVDINL